MAYVEIDASELQPPVLEMLRTALKHARQNREREAHVLPLADFYLQAGLPEEMSFDGIMSMVGELIKVAVISVNYEEGGLQCWPAFEGVSLTKASIEFSVSSIALDATEFT